MREKECRLARRKRLIRLTHLVFCLIIIATNVADATDSGATSKSQSLVIEKFPEIGIAGSDSNKKFIAAVSAARQQRPKLFESEDWPMRIATEVESLKLLTRSLALNNPTIIAEKAESLSDPDKTFENKIRGIGAKLRSFNNVFTSTQSSRDDLTQRVKTLRRNASVNENYKPFNANDNSSKLKAQQLRSQADELEWNLNQEIKKNKSEEEKLYVELRAALEVKKQASELVAKDQGVSKDKNLSLGTKGPSSDRLASNQGIPEDNALRGKSNSAPKNEEKFTPENYKNIKFSRAEVGPKIHGFQLGSTLKDLKNALDKIYPGLVLTKNQGNVRYADSDGNVFAIPIGDLIQKPGTTIEPSIYSDPKNKDRVVDVCTLGQEERVVYIVLYEALIRKMINLNGMKPTEFCQQLVDSYHLESLKKTSRSFSHSPSGAVMEHVDNDGWRLSVNDGPLIDMLMVPTLEERGFAAITPSEISTLGPTIHGLGLGASLNSFQETLRKTMPNASLSDITSDLRKPFLDLPNNQKHRCYEVKTQKNSDDRDILIQVNDKTNEIVLIHFLNHYVDNAFRKQDMNFDEFCQQIADNAKINLKGESKKVGLSTHSYMRFESADGWLINIFLDGRRGRGNFEIQLASVARGSDRGFGK